MKGYPNHWIHRVFYFISSFIYRECWIHVEGFLRLTAYIHFVYCVTYLVGHEISTYKRSLSCVKSLTLYKAYYFSWRCDHIHCVVRVCSHYEFYDVQGDFSLKRSPSHIQCTQKVSLRCEFVDGRLDDFSQQSLSRMHCTHKVSPQYGFADVKWAQFPWQSLFHIHHTYRISLLYEFADVRGDSVSWWSLFHIHCTKRVFPRYESADVP